MAISEHLHDDGVAELVLEHPPVNAFNIGDLHDLAARLRAVTQREEVRAVVFRSEGRGFCGGGDLKEVQELPGFEGILGQASGSYNASLAIAECAVPVVAAIHNYCIGVGVLLAGAADVLVVDEDTRFIMAEIDNGATGGAIQASGLMPEKRLRAAMFTCEPVLARELVRLRHDLPIGACRRRAGRQRIEVASVIASKPPVVVRRAKESMNQSIARDIRRQYRIELSYTYELNLLGEARAARQTFLDGARDGYR